jgi:tetratricopeptide (TPR) repeat protein
MEVARTSLAVAACAALTLLASTARASLQQQTEEFDRRITAELATRDPEGAELFTKARQAAERHDLDAAADFYARVRERDPWFSHATRRLCGVESSRGNPARAIALCREALKADASATNEAALARALIDQQGKPPAEDVREAYGRARSAAGKDPGDAYAQLVLCQCAIAANELRVLESCVAKLKQIDPGSESTMYLSAMTTRRTSGSTRLRQTLTARIRWACRTRRTAE